MSPYKHGKPVYNLSRRPLFIITAAVVLILGTLLYLFVVRGGKTTLKNDNKPLISSVKASATSTNIDEPVFSFSMPGPWKLSQQDWDANYHAWQWSFQDKRYAGRWFRVYLDTIPTSQAVNYLLPVTSTGSGLQMGSLSDNCVNFTPGASPTTERPTYTPQSKASLPSKWQQVNFICDNANVSHQVIGTGTLESINSVTLTGPTKSTHKFFFLYQDNNITPDLNVFSTILETFQVK